MVFTGVGGGDVDLAVDEPGADDALSLDGSVDPGFSGVEG
jgi:hypothetical protein